MVYTVSGITIAYYMVERSEFLAAHFMQRVRNQMNELLLLLLLFLNDGQPHEYKKHERFCHVSKRTLFLFKSNAN